MALCLGERGELIHRVLAIYTNMTAERNELTSRFFGYFQELKGKRN